MAALQLLPADPRWPLQAEAVMAELRAVLPIAGDPDALQPIGSTAVPGLCAKPVLDLMLGVPALDAFDAWQPLLAAHGWRYRPEHEAVLPERRYFVRDAAPPEPFPVQRRVQLRVHLHGLVKDGLAWRRHLAFRDALRTRADWRHDYAALKTRLAQAHPHDKAAYQAGKDPFVTAALQALGL